jgi:hypothetical protein
MMTGCLSKPPSVRLLGLVVQSDLGITVDGQNTKNITTTLQKDCITGKGNN